MTQSDPTLVPDGARLAHGETKVFRLPYLGTEREAFLLRVGEQLVAYLNECPHWSVDLDLGDQDFYDKAIDRIYCKNHGALFFPLSGTCETGPCLGRSLVALEVTEVGADALVRAAGG